jgi:hypothetical protein
MPLQRDKGPPAASFGGVSTILWRQKKSCNANEGVKYNRLTMLDVIRASSAPNCFRMNILV